MAFNMDVYAVAVQSDGKIVCAGRFDSFNGTTVNHIVRLNSDGTRDTTFTTNTGTACNSDVFAISVQSDGKIIIGGFFTTFNGTTVNRIVRLNSDGTRDTTFTTNTGTAFTFQVLSIAIQSDGKIVCGGLFDEFNGASSNRIARLNADGTRDTAFTTSTGSGFFANNVRSIAIQSDGKIVCGGDFTAFNGTTVNYIARLNTNGTLDTAFTANTGTAFTLPTYSIAVQANGKIIVGGEFRAFNGRSCWNIVRLNSDGTLDTVFADAIGAGAGSGFGGQIVRSIAIQSNGEIVCVGDFTAFKGSTVNRIARLKNNETWSTTASNGVSDTSYTFTGLTGGADYLFRARAVNAIGNGPYATSSTIQTGI
jgi:uncharacterized delta-60 repeat protein